MEPFIHVFDGVPWHLLAGPVRSLVDPETGEIVEFEAAAYGPSIH